MTLGLALIMKDELDDLERILKDYAQYFDEIFVTVTHLETLTKIKTTKPPPKLHLSYFKWVNHFGKAREFNRKQVNTDYWFWMDADDTIENPQYLRELVKFMDSNKLDIMYLNYDYFQDEAGNPTNTHQRERIIRTKADVKWSDAPIHETCENPNLRCGKAFNVAVKHRMTQEELDEANKRNTKYLKDYWKKKKDPRTAYYLGLTYGIEENWDKSIEMFKYSLKKGWPEQQADVWNRLAEVHYRKGDYKEALKATDEAIKLQPADPQPYYQKVAIYMGTKELPKALEWGKVAVSKPMLDTMFPVDTTLITHRGPFMVAQVCEALGAKEAAEEIYEHVRKTAPHFYKAMKGSIAVPQYSLI